MGIWKNVEKFTSHQKHVDYLGALATLAGITHDAYVNLMVFFLLDFL